MTKVTELDTTTAQKINALHNEIESLLNQGINKAIERGQLLTAKKAELQHGEFGKWITDNLIFSDRTARNYMRLFENKDKAITAANISEAYKMLAEPKTETVSDLTVSISGRNIHITEVYGRCKASIAVAIEQWNQIKEYIIYFLQDDSHFKALLMLSGCNDFDSWIKYMKKQYVHEFDLMIKQDDYIMELIDRIKAN